jgi:hypothetical protein
MHPEDGPSLSMDYELRLPYDISPFHPLCFLRRRQHVYPYVPSFHPSP